MKKEKKLFIPPVIFTRGPPNQYKKCECEFGWLCGSLKLEMNKKSLICIGWENHMYNTTGKMNNFLDFTDIMGVLRHWWR
jgi:hypothetical protein